jgi:hypothetical protein
MVTAAASFPPLPLMRLILLPPGLDDTDISKWQRK